MSGRDLVSIEGACDLMCVSRRTIYNWMAAGKVEFVRTPGGNVRIYIDTLTKPHDPDDEGYQRRKVQTRAAQARSVAARNTGVRR